MMSGVLVEERVYLAGGGLFTFGVARAPKLTSHNRITARD